MSPGGPGWARWPDRQTMTITQPSRVEWPRQAAPAAPLPRSAARRLRGDLVEARRFTSIPHVGVAREHGAGDVPGDAQDHIRRQRPIQKAPLSACAGCRAPKIMRGCRSTSPPRTKRRSSPLPVWQESTESPSLPGSRHRARRWPVLVFPRRSLGLGRIPRYVGGRKRLETKRSTGNTRVHGDLVTVAA